jgi:hypothetical protein
MQYTRIFLILLLSLCFSGKLFPQKYALAKMFTPVLNTSDFRSVFGGADGKTVKLDKRGLIREMEFIAFPGTVFEILDDILINDYLIYKVTTDDYQYKGDCFIDSRFAEVYDIRPFERKVQPLSKKEITDNLLALLNYPYMWGGNYAYGIYEMLNFYMPSDEIEADVKNLWILKGVDCSGLIYQASGGATPRNTSSLVDFGGVVPIEGKSAEEIASLVEPLDLIVIKGHVVIVLDNENTIESSPDIGVHKTNLAQRISSIMKTKKPVNDWNNTKKDRFVIRRWLN